MSAGISEAALATAFTTVVRRHAPLRSTLFRADDEKQLPDGAATGTAGGAPPLWRVRVDPPESAFIDYWSTSNEAEFLRARPEARGGIQAPIAASAFKAEGGPERLVISVDHLSFDGVSIDLLTNEMNQVLDNLRSHSAPEDGLPRLEQDYYALAQSERAALEHTLAECMPYWREALARCGPYPAVELPGLDPSPPAEPRERVISEVWIGDLAPLRRFCQAQQATPFVVFQAALATAISRLGGRYTGANTNASYRTDPRSWHLIGYFSNLITFAPPAPPDPTLVRGWIDALRKTAMEAIAQSQVPRSTLLRRLFPDTYPARPAAPHLYFELDSDPPEEPEERALVRLPRDVGGKSVKSHPGLECTAVSFSDDRGLLRVAYQDGNCRPEAARALLETWLDIVENELVKE
ncbi:condensation domain-containing protein [Actinomadura verrucosospora]|uniref:condensation domain-containing protein n=1 Tax=Actinomadura verrucosospora TaxID=46165 RepID=UPI001564F25A|nr:condensation domain-containing protein [Actinomadura verrucosospora]